MKLSECQITDQIFTHVDEQKVVRHFNCDAIWRAVFAKKLVKYADLRPVQLTEDLIKFIESSHGIEQDHFDRMPEKRLAIPLLLACMPDGTQCLIDGNHRAVANWRKGIHEVPSIWVDPEGWEPYLVEDMPDDLAGLAEVLAQKK